MPDIDNLAQAAVEQAKSAEVSDTHQINITVTGDSAKAEALLNAVLGAKEDAAYDTRRIQASSFHSGGFVKTDSAAAPSPIAGHVQGLPVKGYAANVEQWKVDMVNENKVHEERALRRVDEHVRNRDSREIDQASVQLARRHIEDGFYRLNRAIMQPKRILGDL